MVYRMELSYDEIVEILVEKVLPDQLIDTHYHQNNKKLVTSLRW